MTKKAFENDITLIITLGGSTNAVLHLIAMADTLGVEVTLDDFVRIDEKTLVIADLRPSGQYLMSELIKVSGILPLMKELLNAEMFHGDCLTVTGKTMAEIWQRLLIILTDRLLFYLLINPLKKTVT
ncbi:MAG: dihydroxy-acid dehydratase [Colwellia sp.]|jgi:dihydroxy-acid dehydratase